MAAAAAEVVPARDDVGVASPMPGGANADAGLSSSLPSPLEARRGVEELAAREAARAAEARAAAAAEREWVGVATTAGWLSCAAGRALGATVSVVVSV